MSRHDEPITTSNKPGEPASTQTFDAVTAVARRVRAKIGPYLIERELGRGAHGRVYTACHPQNRDRLVALKLVENRGSLDSLLLEPEILSRLEHPGIVGLYDYFVHGDDVVVALEYVAGEDLHTCLQQRGPFCPEDVREFLVQTARALAHAHQASVLHRDIKPSNILVDHSGELPRYVLSDFGISRISEGIQTSMHVGGTYYYMAPEQLQGRPGPQSDLWSLGVVAYVMLTGQRPFEGNNLEELSREILYCSAVPPSQRMSQPMDDELEQIILELLEKSLTQRTESAERLLASLLRGEHWGEEATAPGEAKRRPARGTFEWRMKRQVVWCWVLFWIFAGLVLFPLGVLPGAVALLGILIFYAAQSTRRAAWRWPLVAAALGAMAVAMWLRTRSSLPDFLQAAASGLEEGPRSILQSVYFFGLFVYYLIVAPVAIHCIAEARRLGRDLALRRLLRAGATDPMRRLAQLRSLVDHHPEDSDLHHRFAECRAAVAAVEAAGAAPPEAAPSTSSGSPSQEETKDWAPPAHEPFEVRCPDCGRRRKITRPEIVGTLITCMACETSYLVRRRGQDVRELLAKQARRPAQTARPKPDEATRFQAIRVALMHSMVWALASLLVCVLIHAAAAAARGDAEQFPAVPVIRPLVYGFYYPGTQLYALFVGEPGVWGPRVALWAPRLAVAATCLFWSGVIGFLGFFTHAARPEPAQSPGKTFAHLAKWLLEATDDLRRAPRAGKTVTLLAKWLPVACGVILLAFLVRYLIQHQTRAMDQKLQEEADQQRREEAVYRYLVQRRGEALYKQSVPPRLAPGARDDGRAPREMPRQEEVVREVKDHLKTARKLEGQGKHAEAQAHYETAVERLRRTGRPQDEELADMLIARILDQRRGEWAGGPTQAVGRLVEEHLKTARKLDEEKRYFDARNNLAV